MAVSAREQSSNGLERRDSRARLLDAIVDVIAHDGYIHARVGDIARHARMSRASFYEHFPSKEDCFLAAHHRQAARVQGELGDAIVRAQPHQAVRSLLCALAQFASREPLTFTFLTHEAMLAGPRGWEARDQFMAGLQRTVEEAWAHASEQAPVLDISPKLLLEGTVRLVGLRIRRNQGVSEEFLSELLGWIDAYRVPPGPARWREFVPEPSLVHAGAQRAPAPAIARPLPKSKSRLDSEVIRSIQQERIIYAAAEAIHARGFSEVTVADIVARAGVSRDVFYAHFHDKEEAFEGTVKLVFERLLASLAGAFFYSSGDWCDQVWQAGEAFARFLEDNGALAHCMFLGTNAPLPFLGRVDDFVQAFTIFIDAGYHYGSDSAGVPRLVSDALLCAVLESVAFHVRHGRTRDLRGLIPAIVYMVLAPFVGTEAARSFVEGKTRATTETPASVNPLLQATG